jgi:hypothetical protein
MTDAEFSFLQERADKEKGLLIRVVRNLAVIFIILPCSIGITMESLKRSQSTPDMIAIQEREDPHVIRNYFIGMVVLLLLVAIFSTVYYFRTLWKIQQDLKRNLKSIEQTTIDRKQYIKTNDSCFFYLDSAVQLSIEVSRADFEMFNEGDEINIEYSSYSKIYFGYF